MILFWTWTSKLVTCSGIVFCVSNGKRNLLRECIVKLNCFWNPVQQIISFMHTIVLEKFQFPYCSECNINNQKALAPFILDF